MPSGSWNNLDLAKTSPAALAKFDTGGRYQLPPHLALLNKALLNVHTGKIKRLIVTMPPRHGKSMMTSTYFPAWFLGMNPMKQVILCSYEAQFASTFGGKARDIMERLGPPVFGVQVDESSAARSRWQVGKLGQAHKQNRGRRGWYEFTDSTSGVMETAGAGGPITGKGADLLIVDDPVKNAEDANSETIRERQWDWWQSTAYSRLEPGGAAIVIQTRWHEDDLTGRILELAKQGREKWIVLNLPALAEADDPLGRKIGEALWPERYDTTRLKEIEEVAGPYWWSALYQQRPTPLEGAILKRAWMQKRYIRETLPQMERIIQSVDTAVKIGQENDYSVIATWGTNGVDYYLLDVWRSKAEFPELKRMVAQKFYQYEPSGVYVEDASSGQAIIQEFARESMIPVIAVPPVGKKEARLHAVSGLFAAGKVYLPATAPWLAEWINEHLRFPNAAHDDQVDTTSMGLAELAYRNVPIMEWV